MKCILNSICNKQDNTYLIEEYFGKEVCEFTCIIGEEFDMQFGMFDVKTFSKVLEVNKCKNFTEIITENEVCYIDFVEGMVRCGDCKYYIAAQESCFMDATKVSMDDSMLRYCVCHEERKDRYDLTEALADIIYCMKNEKEVRDFCDSVIRDVETYRDEYLTIHDKFNKAVDDEK